MRESELVKDGDEETEFEADQEAEGLREADIDFEAVRLIESE